MLLLALFYSWRYLFYIWRYWGSEELGSSSKVPEKGIVRDGLGTQKFNPKVWALLLCWRRGREKLCSRNYVSSSQTWKPRENKLSSIFESRLIWHRCRENEIYLFIFPELTGEELVENGKEESYRKCLRAVVKVEEAVTGKRERKQVCPSSSESHCIKDRCYLRCAPQMGCFSITWRFVRATSWPTESESAFKKKIPCPNRWFVCTLWSLKTEEKCFLY